MGYSMSLSGSPPGEKTPMTNRGELIKAERDRFADAHSMRLP
jgi:hypothetical protein